ncbi:MAG: glycosyl hydrolase-related protein [Treponema sp.]|jgi:alpha-mannosidase|nr:glycosyl hydrolase-related protein [Treponema sp.]
MLIPKVEQRIDQYLSFLKRNAYREISSLEFEVFATEETFRRPPENADWRKVTAPGAWGKSWYCWWFRTAYCAPLGGRPLFLNVTPNADSLAFIDGLPAGAFNVFHRKIRIDADGAEHTLHVEAYSGHPHGGCGPFEGPSIVVNTGKVLLDFPNTFEGGFLSERLEGIFSLYYDVKTLLDLAKQLDDNSLRKARILKGLYDALTDNVRLTAKGEKLEEQAEKAAKQIAPLLQAKNGGTVPAIDLIGHAHIDHAWLWPIAETERKTARTFSNMLRFIKEYPEFIFIQSQPCQLEIVKNEYPDVFEAVKIAYKNGQWEPNGGMWVEADCNIPSGESLIRQFLVGKAANREMFGDYEADTLWLPDVFGYAAALPQILRGCRIKYFVTSKISWNDTTRFPYDTFIWCGIDGTGINTHFIVSRQGGYNGRIEPKQLIADWNEVQHKEVQAEFIKPTGEGDGGGGTLRADIEMARRLGNLEGAPKTRWTKITPALERIFAHPEELPEWRDELYLELHRGAYTTQARTKRNNRRIEFALRRTEFLASWAALDDKEAYPQGELTAAWKKMLTNQFHDIIPGSSINRVYTEAEAVSAQILAQMESISRVTQKALVPGGGIFLFNDLSWQRRGVITVAAAVLGSQVKALQSASGVHPAQRYTDLDGLEQAAVSVTLPSMGWARFTPFAPDGEAPKSPFSYTDGQLETPFYRVKFDKQGHIVSLLDAAQNGLEQVAKGGLFNAFISAEDLPVFWDAWDIDSDYTRHIVPEDVLESTEVVSSGPLCIRIRRKYKIGEASRLSQDMVCYADNRRIDFDTRADWHEKHRLLKVSFDTAMSASKVRCEVQYGHIFRNTHKNLMQDRAKFEICAHKWIALEEEGSGSGIALLNDCKYGHDVSGGRMRLTLLRSPLAPDPEADQGEHRFTYALLPWKGGFTESGVVRSAYELNTIVGSEHIPGTAGEPASCSLCSVDNPAVIIESVKAPEAAAGKSSKSLVVCLYESFGGHQKSVLSFNRPVSSVMETDMLEGNGHIAQSAGSRIPLAFRPFEIKTLLIHFHQEEY